MANTRDIKKRIKSIASTKKITRAMEMVSAAKMRKAIEAVLKTRPYADLSWATVLNLAKISNNQNSQVSHPLLEKRKEIKKAVIILITSNRGLCGGFNSAIIKKILEVVKNANNRQQYEFILLGKKGAVAHKNFGLAVAADFPKLDYIDEVREVIPVAQMVIRDYLAGKYDKVSVAYTNFINAAKQAPKVKQLLPMDITAADESLEPPILTFPPLVPRGRKGEKNEQVNLEYVFEPSPAEVLDAMLPRLIEIQLFQALLESNASEQSARRLAMHQATEAAGDMASELTLSFNKARQAGVTSEIAEISAGANALAG
jgi:F-type H+-transporting ATPase subunit gamma